METARVLGNNVKLLLNQKSISREVFAETLGYTFFDVQKLCDARLSTTDKDIHEIAEFFDVNPEYLLANQGVEKYTGRDFMHCMGQFKNPDNEEKVLDIIDMYCDLKEALER